MATATFDDMLNVPSEILDESSSMSLPGDDAALSSGGWFQQKVGLRDVAELTAQLAIMVRSGVDVSTALKSLAMQCQRPHLGEVLRTIHSDVLSGSSFSGALRKHAGVFDEAYIATVAAGEATGKMAEVLEQLSELQRSELRMRRTLRAVMIYPIVLTCVSTAVIGALVVFVLPQFATIFEQYDTPLPMITKMLIGVSMELRVRWWLWVPLVGGIGFGAVTAFFTEAGRRMYDTSLLRTAKIKNVVQTLLAGRMCRLMGLMIDSGVPLLQSLHMAGRAIKNVRYRELIAELEDAVTNGQSLASTLQESDIFPASAAEMIGTAEKTGKLGEVLRMIGVYFEEEGEASARQAATLLEPLITVVMGAVVAVVVLAVMLPVFDMASFARGG